MKLLVSLVILATSLPTYAKLNRTYGEWGSGGGNALVCFGQVTEARGDVVVIRDIAAEVRANQNTISDDHLQYIDSIELFDLYEAKKRRGLNSKAPEILEIKKDEEIYDYFDRIGSRFKNNVYVMQALVSEGKKLIPDTQLVFHDFAVEHQNDLGSVTLPSRNCVIATMAAQVNYNDFYEVHIDERLFNHPKHSKQSQATLVLHELIYALARKHFDHKDSGATRNVVRYFISYHETFTEGMVAKALHDVGFFLKDDETPDLMAQYHYSKIMSTISLELESTNDFILSSLEQHFQWGEVQKLNDQVYNQLILEDIADPKIFSKDFFGLAEMIDLGMRRTNDFKTWDSFNKQLSMFLEDIQKSTDTQLDWAKEEILEIIDNESQITDIDRTNMLGHLDNFLYDYKSINQILSFKQIKEERDTYKEAMNSIYENFMYYTNCTGSVDSSTTPNPIPKRKSEVCFEPLLLNNVIPKT